MKLIGLATLAGVLGGADIKQGIDLYKKCKYPDAESALREVVRAEPDNASAQRYLGLSLVELNKLDEAAAVLNRARELEPGAESNAAMARLYIGQKEFDKAQEALQDAGGDDVDYTRGLLSFHKKEYEDAARYLESFSERNPEHSYVHYYAGMAYNGLNRKDKMLSHFEMFLRLNPDAPEARKVRAVLKTGQ